MKLIFPCIATRIIIIFIHFSQTLNGIPTGALVVDVLANDKTPFHHAILLNKLDVAELFLKYEVNITEPLVDSSGFSSSPLQYCCQRNLEDMIKLLLENGVQDKDNVARIEASQSGKENLAQIFLNNGISFFTYNILSDTQF